jgi:type II secretory pathway pseudopilin PulG
VRHRLRLRQRLAAEHGFGILEVVIAAAVLLAFIGAAFSLLIDSQKRTAGAERHEAAISLAQGEVERLRQFGYAELGLTVSPTGATPSTGSNPDNPAEYVSGGNFLVRSNFRDRNSAPPPGVPATGEPFVAPPATGVVDPTPTRMNSGGYLYDVHRYVTWVDLTCVVGGTDQCQRDENTDGVEDPDAKRIVVAVRPAAEQQMAAGATKPVWVTTVVTDPNSVAAGATPPTPPADPTATAQNFYLYDTRCDQSVRVPPAAGHDARDTGRSLDCLPTNSLRPDLMGTDRAPATEIVMHNYSQDYPFARTGGSAAPGLALLPPLAVSPPCPTSYGVLTAAVDKHRVHRWLSPKMPAAFTSTTQSAMAVWTRTVDALAGAATLCVAMHKVNAAGSVVGGALATATQRLSVWPVLATQVQFKFAHAGTPPAAFSLAADERILLTLSLANTSLPGGVELLYDHPTYDTVLSVGTTTPLP